jgi:hypothetical protein
LLAGVEFGDLQPRFPAAVPIGIRTSTFLPESGKKLLRIGSEDGCLELNPPSCRVLLPGDELVVLAEDNDSYAPEAPVRPECGESFECGTRQGRPAARLQVVGPCAVHAAAGPAAGRGAEGDDPVLRRGPESALENPNRRWKTRSIRCRGGCPGPGPYVCARGRTRSLARARGVYKGSWDGPSRGLLHPCPGPFRGALRWAVQRALQGTVRDSASSPPSDRTRSR